MSNIIDMICFFEMIPLGNKHLWQWSLSIHRAWLCPCFKRQHNFLQWTNLCKILPSMLQTCWHLLQLHMLPIHTKYRLLESFHHLQLAHQFNDHLDIHQIYIPTSLLVNFQFQLRVFRLFVLKHQLKLFETSNNKFKLIIF